MAAAAEKLTLNRRLARGGFSQQVNAGSSMSQNRKVIITCAVTGAIHTPSMSPHLPITPDQIVTEALAAAEAGASILHLHARDPKTGKPD